ncbi:hypothetical protein [Marinicellulosiphila megalodicopiae]|uniref:hypothetical protein n=1 Tax=Marinicellulosiphila megalodicopiae TaxID=2724896 RepID=UPI003BB15082
MKYFPFTLPFPFLLVLTPFVVVSCASSNVKSTKSSHLSSELSLCYGLTGLTKMTVINKNNGMSLVEQQSKRKKIMSENSTTYELINDISKRIYQSDLTNSVSTAIDTHQSCIQSSGSNITYNEAAIGFCPMQGGAIDMAGAAKKAGFTKQGTLKLLNTNYPGFSDKFDGGFSQMIQNVYKNKMISGAEYYANCMDQNEI